MMIDDFGQLISFARQGNVSDAALNLISACVDYPATQRWQRASELLVETYAENPAHLLNWPISEARDAACELLMGPLERIGLAQYRRFSGAAIWVDVSAQASQRTLARYTSPSAYFYELADTLASRLNGVPYQFDPVLACWTDSGKRNSHFDPSPEVPGGRNFAPYYSLEHLLLNGAAGVIVASDQVAQLQQLSEAHACTVRVLGEVCDEPSRVLNWDGFGVVTTYNILRASNGDAMVIVVART